MFALYVNSIVFYQCAVLCLWKCWYCSIYLEGIGTQVWQKDYREVKFPQGGIYGIFRALCRKSTYTTYVFYKDKVESCRTLLEALLFHVLSIFLSGLQRIETVDIFSSREAIIIALMAFFFFFLKPSKNMSEVGSSFQQWGNVIPQNDVSFSFTKCP